MKLKPFLTGIIILGSLLLVISATTVAQVWGAYPRYLTQAYALEPSTVQFVPKRSPFFVSLFAKPEDLRLLAQLDAAPSDRATIREQVDRLRQMLQQQWLLNYERDIQPWLGQEITVAMTKNEELDTNKLTNKSTDQIQYGYLVAMVAEDRQLAQQHIEQFWQSLAQQGANLGFERYQGISLTKLLPMHNNLAIAGAVLDKYVLFASDVKVLRRSIDSLRSPSLSILGLANYPERLQQINQDPKRTGKIAIAYLNPQELLDSQTSTAHTPLANLDILAGLSLDGRKPPKSRLRNIIATPYFNQSCPQLSNTLGNKETLNLLPCLDKPYSMSIVIDTSHPPLNASLNPSKWLMQTTTPNPQQANEAIASLDLIAKEQLTVGEILIDAHPELPSLTVWTALTANSTEVTGKVTAVHGQIDHNIYWSNSLELIQSALSAAINSKS